MHFPDTSTTVLSMIKNELTKLDYEVWQPPLGGPGVICHVNKPDLFNTPNSAATTPHVTITNSPQSTPSSTAHRHKK